ncbi:hypothetical protein Noda2021_06060 [Candidatus Dependentiae bacterium Noda2021]|nr:hypothetical protein Noda2021_06060 [Candidatus Dependentiae bacterium Noda2021]
MTLKIVTLVCAIVFLVDQPVQAVGTAIGGFYFQKIINKTDQPLFVTSNRLLNKPAIRIQPRSMRNQALTIAFQAVVPGAMWIAQIQLCSDSMCEHVLATLPVIISKDAHGYHSQAKFYIGPQKILEWKSSTVDANQTYAIALSIENDVFNYDPRDLNKSNMLIE